MVNPRRPRPTLDTISLPNPVVGKLMSPAPRPTVAISIVGAYRFKNMSRTPRAFTDLRVPRWLGFMASSRPSEAPHQSILLPSSSPEDEPLLSSGPQVVPLRASSPTLVGTSHASIDSVELGTAILRQGINLAGRNSNMDEEDESGTEDVDLAASSPTLAGTSYASTGSFQSEMTAVAQGTILRGSNDNMDEEDTSYASTGSFQSGMTTLAQGTILLGSNDDIDEEDASGPEEIPLPTSSPSLSGTSFATSYASTGSLESVATIMAQGTILPGNNNKEEEGNSSTAVVDRSNDPRFRSPEAYLGLPTNEIVEGPKDTYFLHPRHKATKESTDFPFFMFNAIRYPAKSLNKAAAEAFPWKHVETIRAPWVNNGKLLQHDDSLGHAVEQPCDDISKLDKTKLFGFIHEIDGWLDYQHEDVKRYANYLKDIQTELDAIRARAEELVLDKVNLDKELSGLKHKINRNRGLNVLVGTQRRDVEAKIYQIEMYQEDNAAELRQLLQKYHELMAEYNRTVIMALHMDSMDISNFKGTDEKRKAEEKKKQEEEKRLFDFIKLHRQKKVEEEECFQLQIEQSTAAKTRKDKGKAKAVDSDTDYPFPTTTTANQADEANYLLADEDIYNAEPRRPSAKDKGKGKATTSATGTTAANIDPFSSTPSYITAAADPNSSSATAAADDSILENVRLPQPQTLAEAGALVNPHPLVPQNVPSWFTIFDAQQLVSLRSARPRERFDEFMVKFSELYQKAEDEKKAGGAATKKKPAPEIFPEFHGPHREWPTAIKRERGGWWLCRPAEDPAATHPERACRLCKAARAQAAREERERARRGVFPAPAQEEDRRTAQQQYDEINTAMNVAMAQAHVDDAKWLREQQRREDEEKERVRKWKGMSFEEKRDLGFH
ncbi:hypothetical protein B0T09DRAFT_392718 [Sordaria sp. MPI-SDFR-AT-0083]|nr:hypothetical protein B0T09DRAFT_392718 [Sordaria sp. MPI-SDFR-AT-0083]